MPTELPRIRQPAKTLTLPPAVGEPDTAVLEEMSKDLAGYGTEVVGPPDRPDKGSRLAPLSVRTHRASKLLRNPCPRRKVSMGLLPASQNSVKRGSPPLENEPSTRFGESLPRTRGFGSGRLPERT